MTEGAVPTTRGFGIDSKIVTTLVAILLVALPIAYLPSRGMWLGVKAFGLLTAATLVAVVVFSRGDWTWERLQGVLLGGPNPAVLGFLGWVAWSAARSDLPSISRYEAMRYLGGGLLYFALVFGGYVRRHAGRFVMMLTASATLASLLAFAIMSDGDSGPISGAFRNEQLLAGFLCLLLPIVLMASQTDEVTWRRYFGQAATVIVVAAILVARNRSAWLGATTGILVLTGLSLWFRTGARGLKLRAHQILIPAFMVILAIGLFFTMSQMGGEFTERAQSLTTLHQDSSFQWRLGMWNKALRMAQARPVFGWGVGTFPVQQALFFHPACPSRTQRDILIHGATLAENAHNTYLQIGAEVGFVGLGLYLAVLVGFLVTAVRRLERGSRSFRQALLLASVAAVCGQMVSAIGSPAWEFPECSTFLWAVLALGMACGGLGDQPSEVQVRARLPKD